MANLRQNTTIGGAIAANSKNILSIIKSIDGHGSGIDADLLDGRHASEFSLTSHNHDSQYVKKSGDTMTGDLLFSPNATGPIRINCYTDNYWSRGISFQKQNGTKHGVIGAYGNGDTLNHLYFGFGDEPWIEQNAFTVSPTEIKYKGNKVWHSANDGAGSGLDADMIDGIQSSRIIYGKNESGINDFTDANLLWKSGFYQGLNATNCPTTKEWWWLIKSGHSSNNANYRYGFDIAASNCSSNFYMRTTDVNGEGVWRRLWHDGNMGSNSGLDADKVDGKHWTDIENTFVKKAGDNVYGKLTFMEGSDKGLQFVNVKVGAVGSNTLVMRNLDQLRFGSSDNWNFDEWAGVKFVTSEKILYIGGPGNIFSSNSSPSNITIDLSNSVNKLITPSEIQMKIKELPKISPSFTNANSFQSIITLPGVSGSNDPGYIAYETGTGSDSNKCVLHLCPGDDQQNEDYVAIHGVGEPENVKISTVGNVEIARQFISKLGTGTAPIVVNSRTKCQNLNADLLDDKDSSVEATANTIPVRDGNGDLKVAKKLIANSFEMIYDDSTESVNFVFK